MREALNGSPLDFLYVDEDVTPVLERLEGRR